MALVPYIWVLEGYKILLLVDFKSSRVITLQLDIPALCTAALACVLVPASPLCKFADCCHFLGCCCCFSLLAGFRVSAVFRVNVSLLCWVLSLLSSQAFQKLRGPISKDGCLVEPPALYCKFKTALLRPLRISKAGSSSWLVTLYVNEACYMNQSESWVLNPICSADSAPEDYGVCISSSFSPRIFWRVVMRPLLFSVLFWSVLFPPSLLFFVSFIASVSLFLSFLFTCYVFLSFLEFPGIGYHTGSTCCEQAKTPLSF